MGFIRDYQISGSPPSLMRMQVTFRLWSLEFLNLKFFNGYFQNDPIVCLDNVSISGISKSSFDGTKTNNRTN